MEAAKNIMPDDIRDICQRCAHKPTCEVLCYPVLLYLHRSQAPVYEYTAKSRVSDISCIYPEKDQKLMSTIIASLQGKRHNLQFDEMFSTKHESAFCDPDTDKSLIQTRIFVDRVFKKDSFNTIAMRYEVPIKEIKRIYKQAWHAIYTILNYFYCTNTIATNKAQSRKDHKEKLISIMQELKNRGRSYQEIALYLTKRHFEHPYRMKEGKGPTSWSRASVCHYLTGSKKSEVKNG